MTTYLFELPTTGAISFSDFCTDQSTSKAYGAHISNATMARANLRAVLKETKRTDDNEKDYLRIVKILDEYVPLLRGIMSCVAHDEIGLRSEPVFSWRTTLAAGMFHSSARLSLPSLHAEYAYVILTYAFAVCNLARSSVKTLGLYEHDRTISDSERKAKDEKLNLAVNLLMKASGMFSYISQTALLEWDNSRDGGTNGLPKPPDLSRVVNDALEKMTLADAQSLAIRVLLTKSAYDSNIAPGPPLPDSHPKPGLLAKLHLECASLYSSARSLAKTSSTSKGKDTGEGDVTVDLRRYLTDEASFHAALGRKWLGIDAGENGGPSKGGEAVGFLAWAKRDLEELKDSGKGLGIGREKEKKERRKEKVVDELTSVTVFWKHYKKVNDSLTFQAIPSLPDLQARIPAGRLAVAAKPFNPPLPAFGPGSVEYAQQKAEELELQDDESLQGSKHTSPTNTNTYAGAGSYF